MRESWQNLLRSWGVDPVEADRTFEKIAQAYAGPGRFYHTLDHVQEVVRTIESLGSHTKHLHAVNLAAWLHDVIYDRRASDNEERSAECAERSCEELSIPVGGLVASLIRRTKSHEAGGDADAQVLLDADLAILGAGEPAYWDYAVKIRLEYDWVPEPEYRAGRRQILERFLARPRLYHLLGHLEEPARRNHSAEMARLAAG
jgi:predicted metal-dependent HD superfamily phosphohydrolase